MRRAPADVTVRRAALADVFALRHAELRPGLPADAARFPGDDAAGAWHFGAFAATDGAVVGCASFLPAPFRGAAALQLRGMATRHDLVRRGIGGAVLAHAVAEVPRTILWCHARLHAVGFYERMRWTVVSEPFDIPGVGPHVVMRAPDDRPGGV